MAQIKSILFSEILRQKWFYIYTQNIIFSVYFKLNRLLFMEEVRMKVVPQQ